MTNDQTTPVQMWDEVTTEASMAAVHRHLAAPDTERAERLAEWLCEHIYRTPLDEDDWQRLDETGRNVWRRLAEDALAALDPQEPTS